MYVYMHIVARVKWSQLKMDAARCFCHFLFHLPTQYAHSWTDRPGCYNTLATRIYLPYLPPFLLLHLLPPSPIESKRSCSGFNSTFLLLLLRLPFCSFFIYSSQHKVLFVLNINAIVRTRYVHFHSLRVLNFVSLKSQRARPAGKICEYVHVPILVIRK